MITIIRCSECGKHNPLPFILTWDWKEERCKHCGHGDVSTNTYHFCSDKCLKKFVNRFADHKHKWELSKNVIGYSENKKTGKKYVWKMCDICHIDNPKMLATKKEIKEIDKKLKKYTGT